MCEAHIPRLFKHSVTFVLSWYLLARHNCPWLSFYCQCTLLRRQSLMGLYKILSWKKVLNHRDEQVCELLTIFPRTCEWSIRSLVRVEQVVEELLLAQNDLFKTVRIIEIWKKLKLICRALGLKALTLWDNLGWVIEMLSINSWRFRFFKAVRSFHYLAKWPRQLQFSKTGNYFLGATS